MLPHIFGRPVSLVRSPSGRLDDIFFQRHPFTGMPATIGSFETMSQRGRREPKVHLGRGRQGLSGAGAVRRDRVPRLGLPLGEALEKPDRVIFDLDPGEGIKFKQIVEAAFFVREHLEGLGLAPYVKTSGGKGLHVVVPLKPKLDWKKTHAATGEIADRDRQGGARDVRGQHGQGQAAASASSSISTATTAAPRRWRPTACGREPNLPASTPVNWGIYDPSTLRRI